MANTSIYATFDALGTPRNPPISASNYETNPWVLVRVNDFSFTQLLVDLASIRPPRIMTEAVAESSVRGGALAYLISLPSPGVALLAASQCYLWSDTETRNSGPGVVIPFVQPSGYSYGLPHAGRWIYWNPASFGGVSCGVIDPIVAPLIPCALYVNRASGALFYWDDAGSQWVKLIGP